MPKAKHLSILWNLQRIYRVVLKVAERSSYHLYRVRSVTKNVQLIEQSCVHRVMSCSTCRKLWFTSYHKVGTLGHLVGKRRQYKKFSGQGGCSLRQFLNANEVNGVMVMV